MPDSEALAEGLSARVITTTRRRIRVLERERDDRAAPPEGTIVLLHGAVTPVPFWQELMRGLPSDLRVIAIDLRGADPVGRDHLPALTEEVRTVLDALDVDTAHLVGWSVGGAVAVQYALDHPVLSLTLQTADDGVDATGLPEAAGTPPVLWIRGPGEPAEAIREAAAAYARTGGDVTEVSLDGVGDAPHRDRPSVFRQALLERIGYLGHPQDPAPPTEAIILRSAD